MKRYHESGPQGKFPGPFNLRVMRSAHATPRATVTHEKVFQPEAGGAKLIGARAPHFVDQLAEARAGRRHVDPHGALRRNAEEAARQGVYADERERRAA